MALKVISLSDTDHRRWKALLLFSLVVPVGLLATFKLTGVFDGSKSITERITMQDIEWKAPVPTQIFEWRENLTSVLERDDIRLNQKLMIWTYFPSDGLFLIGFEMEAEASDAHGFLDSVRITFVNSENFRVNFVQGITFQLSNLTINGIDDAGVDRYIYMRSTNHSGRASFQGSADCFLSQAGDIRTDAVFETIYFNGTTYNQVLQAFRLGLSRGFHYLKVDASVGGVGKAHPLVTVNGIGYTVPFQTEVIDGMHQIDFQRSVDVNGTTYSFDVIWVFYGPENASYEVDRLAPSLALNITEDVYIDIGYG